MESDDNGFNCKVIVVGDSGVGKTSLMNRFCKGSYSTVSTNTIGIHYEKKNLIVLGKVVNMMIWDTAGQEKFFSLTKMYFRYAMAAVFVYDVTCPKTLFNMEKWFKVVQEEAPTDVIKILVGHKCDDEQSKLVSTNEGKYIADHFGMLFCEVSSKDNINVDSVFYLIATMVVELQENKTLQQSQHLLNNQDLITLENEENFQNRLKCFIKNMWDSLCA